MIDVAIERVNGRIRAFSMKGHAKFAEWGNDIVCSGVSAIVQTALLGLSDYLKLAANVTVDDGDVECRLPGNVSEAVDNQAQAILETMVLGLRAVDENYEGYIRWIGM